jgi:hypothetical protein
VKRDGSLFTPRTEWEEVVRRDLKEIGTSWQGLKREALSRLGWRKGVHNIAGLKWLGAAVSCLLKQ